MIGRLTGVLLDKQPPQILVDVHGLGYEVDVPMNTFYHLPATGERVSLYTHFSVREDAQQLYGFLTGREREVFRALIKISGVGPKLALSVLSGMNVDELTQAVALQETARLVKIPGVGKKTAERLLLELKGKLADALPGSVTAGSPAATAHEALHALMALGYHEREVTPVLKQLPDDLSLEERIRQALKLLAKKA
ncbi:MAG: Holliday junction branch migration protein RuvA [Pseudomonadota bacterium]